MVPTPSETERLLDTSKGDVYRQASIIVLGIFALIFLTYDKSKKIHFNSALSFSIIFFLLWASLSIIWADDQMMTFKRLVIFNILWLSAFSIAKRLTYREIMLYVIFSSALTLLISLGAEIMLKTFQPFSAEYRFSGVMHPNGQGLNCAMLLISSICYFKLDSKFPQFRYLLVAIVASFFLILTKSRTALLSATVAITLFLFLTSLPYRKKILVSFVTFIMPIFCLALYFAMANDIIDIDKSVFLLGRNTEVDTLTGRTPVWLELYDYVVKRPLLGYGYDGFWTQRRTSDIMASQGSWVASDHSSFINIILGLGIIGLATFVIMIILALIKSIRHYKQSRTSAFAFTILIMITISMLPETILFQPYPFSFLVMAILAKLAFVDGKAQEYELNVKQASYD